MNASSEPSGLASLASLGKNAPMIGLSEPPYIGPPVSDTSITPGAPVDTAKYPTSPLPLVGCFEAPAWTTHDVG